MTTRAVLVLASCFIAACGNRPANEHSVGVILSLSGPAAPYGQDNQRGLELAADSINRAGGIDGGMVRLLIRDDGGDATQAVTLMRQFAADTSIIAVLGPTRTGSTVAASKLLPELKVPMISVGATGDWNSAAGAFNEWTWRTTRVDTYLIEPLLQFARDSAGVRRVALFYTSDDDWSRSLVPVYRAAALKLGVTLIDSVSQRTGDLDRSAQLERVRRGQPDALILNVLSTDAPTIASQARRLGFRSLFLGTAAFSNPQTWTLADSGVLDGTILAENYYAESDRDIVRAFTRLYRDRHQQAAPPYSAYGWDGLFLLADACRRATNCRDRADLRNALGATRDLDLVLGKVTYNGAGDALKTPLILEIRNNAYVRRAP